MRIQSWMHGFRTIFFFFSFAEIVFCIFEPIKLDLEKPKKNKMSKRPDCNKLRADGRRIRSNCLKQTNWIDETHTQIHLRTQTPNKRRNSFFFWDDFRYTNFSFCRFSATDLDLYDSNKIAGFWSHSLDSTKLFYTCALWWGRLVCVCVLSEK